MHHGPGDAQALLFAAGQRNRIELFLAGKTDLVERREHAPPRLLAIETYKLDAEEAAGGEKYEFTEMYPGFIAEAEKEGNKAALATFRNANEAEKVHHELYNKGLEAVKAGQDLPGGQIFVCQGCGHTVLGEAPDRCPICGAKKEKYMEIV